MVLKADTNQRWSEEWGVDAGPDYTHCIRCGTTHLFPGQDYCRHCTRIRTDTKKSSERGECRGGCGCTVQWHSLRCGACRADDRWVAKAALAGIESSAVDWERHGNKTGVHKEKDEKLIQKYMEHMKGNDGRS